MAAAAVIPFAPGELAQQAATTVATLWDRCTLTRSTGTGTSQARTTVATAVPYRRDAANPADWGLAPGAIVGKVLWTLEFRGTQDVQVQDTVTDTATGERMVVRRRQPAGSYEGAQLVLAEQAA